MNAPLHKKIAILGAGAWGTALALGLSSRAHTVMLWSPTPEHAAHINLQRENQRYLPGHSLPLAVVAHHDFAVSVADATIALVATPLAGLRVTVLRLLHFAPQLPFIWVCKGLETESGLLPHQVVDACGANHIQAQYGVISGPSFAEEVARGLPTAVTLAAHHADFAAYWAQALHTPNLRIYTNDDLIGVEVGGAVKNVLAIAVGIADGLALGFNARAALMTRGLAEMTRFGLALGARRETLAGLSGAGDLILTCTGDLSRNRRVGLLLAAGQDINTITASLGHVAEGVPAARAIHHRAQQLGIDMPITKAVCAVLDGLWQPQQAVAALLARDPKTEA